MGEGGNKKGGNFGEACRVENTPRDTGYVWYFCLWAGVTRLALSPTLAQHAETWREGRLCTLGKQLQTLQLPGCGIAC